MSPDDDLNPLNPDHVYSERTLEDDLEALRMDGDAVATAALYLGEKLDWWCELQEERNALLKEVNAHSERRQEFDRWYMETYKELCDKEDQDG